MKTEQSFYRGARVLNPASHIVIVVMLNGSKLIRRTSLTAVQMAQVECRLVRAQYSGEIADYLITAAEGVLFSELLPWIDSLKVNIEQPALLNVQQNSLFNGGSL
jgi:hypothetical protein